MALLKTARLLLEGVLQVSGGRTTFCNGLLDRALAHAVTNVLIYGMCNFVLRAHDAEDRPANRITWVPLTKILSRKPNSQAHSSEATRQLEQTFEGLPRRTECPCGGAPRSGQRGQ